MQPTLYKQYKETVIPALKASLGVKNVMEVPRIEKVTINVGYGRHTKDKAYKDMVEKTLTVISGQKPVHNKATKSISNFKIREGQEIGASVVLRGTNMYEFLYRLIHITFPRVRDFRGLNPKSVDSAGNCSLGFKENIAFPEITADAVENIHGLEVVITTTAKSHDAGLALLKGLGFPFKEEKKK